VLVGDRDRDRAGSALRRHFVHGRLSTAEFEERIDLTLRARSRDHLDAAMDGLPPAWWDLPGGVHAAAWRLRRRARRVRFFFALVRLWLKVNLALLLALGLALVVGAPVAMTLGAAVVAWALVSFGVWRLWSRGPSIATARVARIGIRRK
jgi:ABC-type multidrug transport system fused ATPase/permease subunit